MSPGKRQTPCLEKDHEPRSVVVRDSVGCKAEDSGNAYNKVSIGYLCSFAGDKTNAAILGKRVYILVEKQLDATGKETGCETLAERSRVGTVEKLAVALNDSHFLVL